MMSSTSASISPLLFAPGDQNSDIIESFTSTPTYLFRLYAPATRGTTNTNEVSSPTPKGSSASNQDLFGLPEKEAAAILRQHLFWECQQNENCNLMSWSSSLLSVLKHGFYRKETDRDHPTLDDIHILILDTRLFPKGTFIRDLEVLGRFAGYNERLRTLHGWRKGQLYFGEYLSQGHLNIRGHCAETTLQKLVDGRLLTDLCPTLAVGPKKWATGVVRLRQEFKIKTYRSAETERMAVAIAITLASDCFEDRWRLAVSIMLLSLRPHDYGYGGVVVQELCELLSGRRYLISGRSGWLTQVAVAGEILHIDDIEFGKESYMEKMPELMQYRKIMKAVRVQAEVVEQTNSSDSNLGANALAGIFQSLRIS